MRYLVKYTKEGEIKFVSHLDLMRTIQRNVRRAELPIAFSKGFNPHMAISIAQPLSVGMYSSGEYLDMVLAEEVKEEEIISRLNETGTMGVKFLEAVKVEKKEEKKHPQAMALIDGAQYTIRIKCTDSVKAEEQLKKLYNKDIWETLKKSKSGEKIVDIKRMIKEFKFWVDEENLVVNALIACGSRENLSAQLLAEYISHSCEGTEEGRFIDIKREEMYATKNDELVLLSKYFS
ncbi:MAG: TIGR03936 family radical SAM-associated protein [Clostridium sp.]